MVENKHNKGWFPGLQGESKKSVISGAWCKIVPIFVQLSCMVFLQYFLKFLLFLGVSMAQKKCEPLFSLKIKSSEKQKCV